MPSHPDFALWLISVLTELFVCGLIVLRGRFRRYRMLALYFGGCALVESVHAGILMHYGILSTQYMYLYYFSDCLLTLLLYFAVVDHFERVCDSGTARKYVRIGS